MSGFSGKSKSFLPPAEPETELPGKITSIETQKRHPDRISLFVDGVFILGMPQSFKTKFSLTEGNTFSADDYSKIRKAAIQHKSRDYLLNLLSRREHSRFELYQKAARKGYASADLDSVLDELRERNYQSDERFAASFARDKRDLKKWGPVKIKSHLISKGVSRKIIDQILKMDDNLKSDIRQSIRDLVYKNRKRFKRELDILRRRKKIYDFLIRKGYPSNEIASSLDELETLIHT